MKKILFPTDFSPAAAAAYDYAQELATLIGGVVDLLNIYHMPIGDASAVPPEYIQRLLDDAERSSMEELEQLSHPYARRPTTGVNLSVYGLFTAREITDFARRENYGLIVMGTKGERSLLEKFMGSVTTEVMLNAPCPVFAIPDGAKFEHIRCIAYATTFEPNDEHAVEQLMELAGMLGAKVHFVHVNTRSGKEEIEELKWAVKSPYHFAGFSVVHHPSVMEGLDNFLKERKVDCLSLYIPQRQLLERLFHSSFTKRMTFQTSVPLLVFHA